MPNVTLAGYPEIVRMNFLQTSGAKPGRIMVDLMVRGSADVSNLPRYTDLTINARNFAGTWYECRLIKVNRVRNGIMRCVLEDSRWRFAEKELRDNYNERDSLGNVLSGKQKSIAELIAILSNEGGVAIIPGNLPAFEPPARWAGVNAATALDEFLKVTGCRMVYNPLTGIYRIAQAKSEALPSFNDRLYRPGPTSTIRSLTCKSHPITYEDKFPVKAKQIDASTGELVDLPPPIRLPNTPTEDYGQTRLRLWAPETITFPESMSVDNILLLDKRVKSHMFDPKYPLMEEARILRDEYARFPHHRNLGTIRGEVVKAINVTGGGRAYLTDHPIMTPDDSGALKTEASMINSYHVKDSDSLRRETKEIVFDVLKTERLEKTLDWIKPVESTQSDVGAPAWPGLLDTVATAMSKLYEGPTSTVFLSQPVDVAGNPGVGAARYWFELSSSAKIYFSLALNFDPGSQGAID